MKVVIDFDGTITANPEFFSHFVYLFNQNRNDIIILTASKKSRMVLSFLEKWGISPVFFLQMDPHDSNWKKQAEWKIETVKELKPDIWIDNDFKMWERVFGIDLDKELPGVTRLQI
jgi:hypothetical protein